MDYIALAVQYWWILIIVGAVIAYKGKKFFKIPTKYAKPAGAIIAIAGLLAAGSVFGLYTIPEEVTVTPSIQSPTFTVVPVANTSGFHTNCTVNDAKTQIRFPYAVGAKDWILNDGSAYVTTARPARCHFLIAPIAPLGSKTDDLCTIYYSMTPTNIEPIADSNRWIIVKNTITAEAQQNFTAQKRGVAALSPSKGSGQISMTYTDTAEVWLDFLVSNSTIAKYLPTLSGQTFTVTFRNQDYTWSKSFDVEFLKISDLCSNV